MLRVVSASTERRVGPDEIVAPQERGEIMDLVRIFEARVLNVGGDKMMLSLSGAPSRLDDFEDLLRPYGIVELQRSGRIALPRLSKTS